jgi:hypothetical protein
MVPNGIQERCDPDRMPFSGFMQLIIAHLEYAGVSTTAVLDQTLFNL